MPVSSSSTPMCTAEPSLREHYQARRLWMSPLLGLSLAGIVTVLLLRSTATSLVSIWYRSGTYSYGFAVLPICIFLAWRRRSQLKTLEPTASLAGVAFALLFALVWLMGNVADVQVVQQFAFIGLLDALVWTFLGNQAVRALRFALLFLFFAVPMGEGLVGPLQRLTAVFTVNAVRLSGIPAVQDGFVISTPSGDWRIAEACSGIRYLAASIFVGVLFAGIAFRSWKRRVPLVLISLLVPILANAVRAYLIIMVAYLTNNQVATGIDHVIYGWVFFSFVTALLIGLALRWREPDPTLAQDAGNPNELPTAHVSLIRVVGSFVLVVLIVAAATATADFLWTRTPPDAQIAKQWSPPDGWLAAPDPNHDWAPSFETIESDMSEAFTNGSQEVFVYVAAYAARRRGVELVNASNAVESSGGWSLLDNGRRTVRIGGRSLAVAEYLLNQGGQRRIVWVWYLIGEHLTAQPWRIKMLQAESRLRGRPTNVFLFAVSAELHQGVSEAVNGLSDFTRDMSFADLRKSATP